MKEVIHGKVERVPWSYKRPECVRRVIREVAQSHQMTPATLLSRCPEPVYVSARRDAARRLKTLGFSTSQIGKWLGGLHCTTVLAYLKAPDPVITRYDTNEPDESGVWAI